MSIFMQVHTTADGKEIPLVSMDADHLVNMINLVFNKRLQKELAHLRNQIEEKFAPAGMSEKQRITLGLKMRTEEVDAKVVEAVERYTKEYMENAIEGYWQYIVVGVCRDDTRDGVVRILQEATGVNDMIHLPQFIHTPSLSSGEVVELDDDDDDFEDQEYIEDDEL